MFEEILVLILLIFIDLFLTVLNIGKEEFWESLEFKDDEDNKDNNN